MQRDLNFTNQIAGAVAFALIAANEARDAYAKANLGRVDQLMAQMIFQTAYEHAYGYQMGRAVV